MRIAVINRQNRVTNVLGLAPGVDPSTLREVDRWLLLPDTPVRPGWLYDEPSGEFRPPQGRA